MLVHKVISDIAHDHSLTPLDVRVWVLSTEYLEMVDFRPLKLETIAQDCGASKTAVHRSVAHLVDCGYLERGPRDGQRRANSFRVPLSRVYPRDARLAA